MKKIFLVLAAMVVALMMFAGPANATGGGYSGDKPDADNKKVTLCHATGSENNPYVKITVSVSAFYQSGHIDHEGDIWEQFVYVTKAGDTVIVGSRGNTDLLAFENCAAPKVDEKIVKPDVTFNDECGTENDVFAVPQGTGYTVFPARSHGEVQTITVKANDGFVFTDGSKVVTFERPLFTDEDCFLPETGGKETAAGVGIVALAAMAGAGVMLFRTRRKTV